MAEIKPRIRKYLFLLSLFFALPMPVVSDASLVEVDWEAQTLTIDFLHLQVPEANYDQAETALTQLPTADCEPCGRANFQLDTFFLVPTDTQLNATLRFYFPARGDLAELLNIQQDGSKQKTMEVLELEQLVHTNGQVEEVDGRSLISWPADQSVLNFQLAHRGFEKDTALNRTKPLLPVWDRMQE